MMESFVVRTQHATQRAGFEGRVLWRTTPGNEDCSSEPRVFKVVSLAKFRVGSNQHKNSLVYLVYTQHKSIFQLFRSRIPSQTTATNFYHHYSQLRTAAKMDAYTQIESRLMARISEVSECSWPPCAQALFARAGKDRKTVCEAVLRKLYDELDDIGILNSRKSFDTHMILLLKLSLTTTFASTKLPSLHMIRVLQKRQSTPERSGLL